MVMPRFTSHKDPSQDDCWTTAPDEQPPKEHKVTKDDLINSLGIGLAQLRVVLLGSGGLMVCDGAELFLVSVLIMSISSEFGLTPNERALMMTVVTLGSVLGSAVAGYLGDTMGRRLPIISSYLLVGVFGLLTAFAPNYPVFLVCRMVLATGVGVGIPPSRAMLSELTPKAWRMAMGGLTSAQFHLGAVFVGLLVAEGDATMEHLHWRWLVIVASVLPLLYSVLAFFFLPESPVYLASVGRRLEAESGFRSMGRLNGCPGVPTVYEPPEVFHGTERALALSEQIATVISQRFRKTTAGLCLAMCIMAATSTTFQYAGPRILQQASLLPAAWQILLNNAVGLLWAAIAAVIANRLSRSRTLALTVLTNALLLFLFALGGMQPRPRARMLEVAFETSNYASGFVMQLGVLTLYQMAVETYPTVASTTGAALVVTTGKVSSLVTPFLFERFQAHAKRWDMFFYLLAALSALSTPVMMLFQNAPGSHEKTEISRSSETKWPGKFITGGSYGTT